MSRIFLVILLTLMLTLLACSPSTLPTTPGFAPVLSATSIPEVLTPLPTVDGDPVPSATLPASGLQVVYSSGGNLWLWNGASARQLSACGDVSEVRFSKDGQWLAFLCGGELWVLHSDGTGERLLVPRSYLDALVTTGSASIVEFDWFGGLPLLYFRTQLTGEGTGDLHPQDDLHLVDINQPVPYQWLPPGTGGRVSVAPNNSLVTISDRDSIDVIDLGASSRSPVVDYAPLADDGTGFLPEVVWSPDSSGFKTVIFPIQAGQAEMLYVFPTGVLASLAKFETVSVAESPLYLSPDGGYLIYVAKLGTDNMSLYLMDSSGAARPYGEAGPHVRAYGWLPDSKHFLFGWTNPARVFLGGVSNLPVDMTLQVSSSVRWVDAQRFLSLQGGDLYLGDLNGEMILLAAQVDDYDFISLMP